MEQMAWFINQARHDPDVFLHGMGEEVPLKVFRSFQEVTAPRVLGRDSSVFAPPLFKEPVGPKSVKNETKGKKKKRARDE